MSYDRLFILYSLNNLNIMKCLWHVINSYMIISLLVFSVVVVLSIQYILFLASHIVILCHMGVLHQQTNLTKTKRNRAMYIKSSDIYDSTEYDCKNINFVLFFYYFWERHKILYTDHSSWSTCCTAYMRIPHYSFILFSFDFKNGSRPESVKLERFDLHFII